MTVKLEDAMILWNDDLDKKSWVNPSNACRIKVVNHADFEGNKKFDYLSKSLGACGSEWRRTSDVARAGFIMSLFNVIVNQHRLMADEVHEAFMEIDEYKEFTEPDNYNEQVYTNPFWKLYFLRENAEEEKDAA